MHVTPTVWIVTIVVIAGLFCFDFFFHVRKAHVPTLKEAAIWSSIYISVAIIFGLFVLWKWGAVFAGEYYAGYITEETLSIDNLFVFLIIMSSFAVPPRDQQKALMWGIILALVFRLVFILIGKAALDAWSWLFYIFALFLLYTAYKQVVNHISEVRDKKNGTFEEPNMSDNPLVKLARRFLPLTDDYVRDDIVTKIDNKRYFTPMLLVIITLGSVDLMFALDSIPAVYGLTNEAYLVFCCNAFALMGLRQLYFLIDGLLDRLVYLAYGLAAILGFIAIKLWLHAMHTNTLPFVNGGEPMHGVWEIGIGPSLAYIVGVLVVVVITSLLHARRHPEDPLVAEANEKLAHKHDLDYLDEDA